LKLVNIIVLYEDGCILLDAKKHRHLPAAVHVYAEWHVCDTLVCRCDHYNILQYSIDSHTLYDMMFEGYSNYYCSHYSTDNV